MMTHTPSEHLSEKSSDGGSSSDSDDNAELDCENPFICEICDSQNDNTAVFKERWHLDTHILKNHSTVCIGCYDVFESKKRLFEHLEIEKHEKPSYCSQCQGVFLDDADMKGHNCGDKASVVEESLVPVQEECISSDDATVEGHDCRDKDSVVRESLVTMKEECISSDDDQDDATTVHSSNAFLCEVCYSDDNESHAVFKERNDLVLHTFKNHPCSCIGCFENFHTSDDLKKHVMTESHELPVCHECWRLFPDNIRLVSHHCEETLVDEDHGDENIDDVRSEDDELSIKMEPQSEDDEDELSIKMEPQSENEGSEYVCSNEENSSDESEPGNKREKNYLSCLHCNAEGFRKQHDLRAHTCSAHPSVCIVCFEGFDDEMSLQNHQKVMHHTVWKCSKCDRYFLRQAFYRAHVNVNHPEDCPYKCPDCDMRSFLKSHIEYHHRKEHTKKLNVNIKLNWKICKMACHICFKFFMTRYSLLLHMFREHNEPGQTHVYKCELCQLGFGRAAPFEIHLKEDHADDVDYLNDVKTLLQYSLQKPVTCDKCYYLASSFRCLQRHVLTKHPEMRPHKCNICDARYPEESDLRVHNYCDHGGVAPIVCPLCDFTGRNTNVLENHLKNSHGYQGMPYMFCFIHKRVLITYSDYRTHFELYHMDPADRPVRPPKPTTGYPCQFCGREYGQAFKLKLHLNRAHYYTGERIKCDVCGITFKDERGLTNHKIKHTDTFKCKICNKTFEMQCLLDRHQVVHSGEKPFQCEVCGLKVSQKSALQRHVKVVHADGKLPKRLVKSRRTRGPKSEGTVKKEVANEEKNLSIEDEEVSKGDKVKTDCTRNRKRRRDSKSSSGASPEEETIPPKRRRRRPRKDKSEVAEQLLNDSASPEQETIPPKRKRGRPRKDQTEVAVRRPNNKGKKSGRPRGRPRKAKNKAEKQLKQQHLQGSDDEDLLSNDSDWEEN